MIVTTQMFFLDCEIPVQVSKMQLFFSCSFVCFERYMYGGHPDETLMERQQDLDRFDRVLYVSE